MAGIRHYSNSRVVTYAGTALRGDAALLKTRQHRRSLLFRKTSAKLSVDL